MQELAFRSLFLYNVGEKRTWTKYSFTVSSSASHALGNLRSLLPDLSYQSAIKSDTVNIAHVLLIPSDSVPQLITLGTKRLYRVYYAITCTTR